MPWGMAPLRRGAEPSTEAEQGGDELQPEEALAQDAATEADEGAAEAAPVGADSPDESETTVEQPEE